MIIFGSQASKALFTQILTSNYAIKVVGGLLEVSFRVVLSEMNNI